MTPSNVLLVAGFYIPIEKCDAEKKNRGEESFQKRVLSYFAPLLFYFAVK
jgi:hypothetical protein